MRNIMYLSFAAFIFAMSGCSNETFEEGYGRTGNDILVATIPSVESRTYMDGVSVKWSAGDKIGIFPNRTILFHMRIMNIPFLVRRVHRVRSFRVPVKERRR